MTSSHGHSLAATHPPSNWRAKNGLSCIGVTGPVAQGGPFVNPQSLTTDTTVFRNITPFTRSLSGPIQFDPESCKVRPSSDMRHNRSILPSGSCNLIPAGLHFLNLENWHKTGYVTGDSSEIETRACKDDSQLD
ncbi:hypothetical protein Q7C36_002636 [Tachysurus vachellii]|uniref:Uncharacterized protein n=1 Tax=Tachysurus vachellii TaxID=175792 RepID=A0AA88NY01_TACVA|nr:hypothetical protein Q7C36_002636 [Tachysurus vachellii]